MCLSSPPRFAFTAWCVEGRHLLAQRPRTFLLGAAGGVLLTCFPLSPLTDVHGWPLVYALVTGWLCRRVLPRNLQAPADLPWVRLLLVGAVAGLPFVLWGGLLSLVGAVGGEGAVLVLLLLRMSAILAPARPEWLWAAELPAAAVSLVCAIAIGLAPAFVAVAGYGVRRALAESVRCWCRYPVAAGATLASTLLLLTLFLLVYGLLRQVHVVAGLLGGLAYGIVCALAGAAISVAASAAALAQVPAVAHDSAVRQGVRERQP
jgi:hypothetical protein